MLVIQHGNILIYLDSEFYLYISKALCKKRLVIQRSNFFIFTKSIYQTQLKKINFKEQKMALQPLVSSMLIDFDQINTSADQKAYQKQVYSAIKLNMNDLESYEVIDKFTPCLKCKQVLTDKDKGYVFDCQEVQSNPTEFGKQSVQQLRKAKFTKVLWKCTFCYQNNIINITDLRFAKNKTRVIQKEKNAQKKDPIILIVFDVSGSMEESIEDLSGKSWQHLQKIKSTKIYKKIVADEQKELQELIKSHFTGSQPKDSKFKYVDHLKKNKLLMGLTEYLVGKMNFGKKGVSNQQSNKKINDFCRSGDSFSKNETKNKTIGFMFFNSNVMLNLDAQNANKVLLVDRNEEYKFKIEGFETQIVDFDSFETLFKAGQKFGDGFSNKISNFDFQSLSFRSMSNYTQGQTALGPAIVTALGVVSKHGQGSSIVVVTDGIGNKGIFDQTEPWDESYKLLKLRLQKLKCFMTVLQFRKQNDKNKMKEEQNITGLDKFCLKYNDSVVKKINVLLSDIEKSNQPYATSNIEEIQKKMRTGIDRDNSKFSNQVNIRCQHPLISYEKSKIDLEKKLFNHRQPVHILPDYQEKKLTPKDYLHHFMTQIVIKYEDIKTGEQCVFMSYIIQKFIKYSQMKSKDLKSLDNEHVFMNIIEYLHNEEQQLSLDNLPLGMIRETFRKTLCRSSVAQRTLRFPNKQMSQEEISNQWMQNMKRFEEEAFSKKQKEKQSQKSKGSASIKEVFGSKKEEQRVQMKRTQIAEEDQYNQQQDDEYISL